MRHAYLRLLAALVIAIGGDVVVAMAQGPVSDLALTCPNAGAIGQPQSSCSGLTYQQAANDQLIVLRNNGTWARAANLAATDLLAVCVLPVQPGTYSSCRDSSGVRRITYVPKALIFVPPPLPPPPTGTQTLDLSKTPVEIVRQGVYVLDRNWFVGEFAPPGGVIIITGNGVTLDLQGFEFNVESNTAIVSSGHLVTIRNGTVWAEGGTAIRTSGSGTRIEHVLASVGSGVAIDLGGLGSTLTESTASAGLSGTGVRAGDDTIVRNSTLSGRDVSLRASSRVLSTNNEIECSGHGPDPCIEVVGTDNVFSGNRINERSPLSPDGLVIRGNFNYAMDNVFSTTCDLPFRSARAIVVEGQGNTIRNNLVPSCAGVAGWEAGIVLLRDGNLFGGNVVWAIVPFNVGATVQRDLGGNVAIVQ